MKKSNPQTEPKVMPQEVFKRDYRSPVPASVAVSRLMRGNKGEGTRPELALRRALWEAGLRGYRLHLKLPGKPDIVFTRWKVAVFVHGCFWHRCPRCNWHTPRAHTEYWAKKFARTVERDAVKAAQLRDAGWQVEVIWECELKDDLAGAVSRVERAVSERGRD